MGLSLDYVKTEYLKQNPEHVLKHISSVRYTNQSFFLKDTGKNDSNPASVTFVNNTTGDALRVTIVSSDNDNLAYTMDGLKALTVLGYDVSGGTSKDNYRIKLSLVFYIPGFDHPGQYNNVLSTWVYYKKAEDTNWERIDNDTGRDRWLNVDLDRIWDSETSVNDISVTSDLPVFIPSPRITVPNCGFIYEGQYSNEPNRLMLAYSGISDPSMGELDKSLTAYYTLDGSGPLRIKREYDFYYRTRYGAEFPWENEPEPTPSEAMIVSTESHAFDPKNPSKTIPPTNVTVYDHVAMVGLTVGETYTIGVNVYDRMWDDFLDTDGVLEFVATASSMEVDVPIAIDASGLDGDKLVLFTYLLYKEEIIWAVNDEFNEHVFLYVEIEIPEEPSDPPEPDYSGYAVDANFNNLGPIENFNSLIWTDRYSKCGDFEIVAPWDDTLFNTLQVDHYLFIPESDRYMIVEKVEINSNTSEGTKLTISGRSLESLLDRRIIWNKTTIDGSLQDGIKKLIINNIIDPPNLQYRRKISGFKFLESTDPDILSLTLNSQYVGDNLYTVISDICESNNIGFKVYLDNSNEFVFTLYKGKDRSINNPHNNNSVIFSPDFGNMVDCDYVINKESHKNVCLVGGEGDGDDQIFASYGNESYDGLARRETYISESSLSREYTEGDKEIKMTDNEYKDALAQRGKEELSDLKVAKSIDGTMDTANTQTPFHYLHDEYGKVTDNCFHLGEIVECEDLVHNHLKAEICEVIISKNSSGTTIYPTFKSLSVIENNLIVGQMSTFADNANQPFYNIKLDSEYFTYDDRTRKYTCLKDIKNADFKYEWKWADNPVTKMNSIIDIYISGNSIKHFEISPNTSGNGSVSINNMKVGDTFWMHKEQHGNAYFCNVIFTMIEEVE